MTSGSSKKPNLYNLMVADDTSRFSMIPFENRTNRLISDLSTLDTSTVPTYEEFITKTTKKNNLNKFLLNSTHANTTAVLDGGLVTDDDSSCEESNDENDYQPKFVSKNTPKVSKIAENEENMLLKSFDRMNLVRNDKTPSASLARSQKATPKNIYSPSLLNKNSKLIQQNHLTPKSLLKINSPYRGTDSAEYVAHACISTQTSFIESPKVIDDSIIEISPNQSSKNFSNRDDNEMTTGSNLILRLSSSSTSPCHESNELSNFNNITVRRSGIKKTTKRPLTKRRLSITSGKYVSVSKTNKRVSVCGEGFSDDVLQIDETILDDYENALDHKKGKLFVIDESYIEKDTNASYNNYADDAGQLSVINETCSSQTEIVLDSSTDESTYKGSRLFSRAFKLNATRFEYRFLNLYRL